MIELVEHVVNFWLDKGVGPNTLIAIGVCLVLMVALMVFLIGRYLTYPSAGHRLSAWERMEADFDRWDAFRKGHPRQDR